MSMSLSAFMSFTIEGTSAGFRVSAVLGTERIHEPFRFAITCVPVDSEGAVDTGLRAEDILAQAAELRWSLPDGGERLVKGVVEEVEIARDAWTIAISPRAAAAASAVDHRVFVEKDAVEIATEVLADHAVSVTSRVTRSLPKRPQCAQAFESDLGFVSRVLAEEGIAWVARPEEGDAITLVDHPAGYDDVEGVDELRVAQGAGLVAAESVSSVRLKQARVTDKVSLRDLNFRMPMLDLSVATGAGPLERYEYPGGYNEDGVGEDLAKIRLEEERARRVVLTGETTSPRLSAGRVIKLADAERSEVNARWLVVEVRHAIVDHGAGEGAGEGGGDRYRGRFTAVPADATFRPARPPQPTIGGVQTATVTSASGAEINTEEYGRVKARFRWDRERPKGDTSSKWMRVAQPPLSGGFFQPRVGWEVMLGFQGASADSPIVLGRLYNGQAPPPEGLPGKKVVSAFGSLTTPGGGSGNVIRLDDTAGSEGMAWTASKDWNERTENDKKTSIAASDATSVGGNRKVIVGQVFQVGVAGAQSYSVGASRAVNVDANKAINAASEAVIVGGLRLFNVGGDQVIGSSSLTRVVGGAKVEAAIEHQKRHVTGASMVLVGGGWSVKAGLHATTTVAGAHTELVSGAKNIKTPRYSLKVRGALNETLASRSISAGGDRGENFTAAAAYEVGGSMKIEGADVVFTAKSKITLKAGGMTIVITPGSVKVDGDYKSSTSAVEDGKNQYP
jgi:type VI secretion system secreted protein VgrG